jgi:hypothetical protein
MDTKKKNNPESNTGRAPEKADNPDVKKAHDQADKDISADAELSAHSPNDDLDEGETARLGEDKTDLV